MTKRNRGGRQGVVHRGPDLQIMYVPLPDYGQADYQIMLGGRMYVVPVDDVEELISALQLAKTDADEQRSHENPYFREVE